MAVLATGHKSIKGVGIEEDAEPEEGLGELTAGDHIGRLLFQVEFFNNITT